MTKFQEYTSDPESWSTHLDKDETLIWTGEPIPEFRWHTQGWLASILFVLQIALGMFIISGLSMGAVPVFTWHPMVTALFYFGPGLALLCPIAVWTWAQRRSACYALSNKRALVALKFPIPHLKSYPIYKDKPITVGYSSPKSLYFAHEPRQAKFANYIARHGFDHLADFDGALKHATSVQDDAPSRPRSITGTHLQWPLESNPTNAA
jgi:hypothetical protein